MYFRLSFLVRSKIAQKIPENKHIRIDNDKIISNPFIFLLIVSCIQNGIKKSKVAEIDQNNRNVNNYSENDNIKKSS